MVSSSRIARGNVSVDVHRRVPVDGVDAAAKLIFPKKKGALFTCREWTSLGYTEAAAYTKRMQGWQSAFSARRAALRGSITGTYFMCFCTMSIQPCCNIAAVWPLVLLAVRGLLAVQGLRGWCDQVMLESGSARFTWCVCVCVLLLELHVCCYYLLIEYAH